MLSDFIGTFKLKSPETPIRQLTRFDKNKDVPSTPTKEVWFGTFESEIKRVDFNFFKSSLTFTYFLILKTFLNLSPMQCQ